MPAYLGVAVSTMAQDCPNETRMNKRARLHTFLHGIEPRAWVFLNLHCGDPERAAELFRASVRTFSGVAQSEPLARWPMLFWTTLLAQPGLSTPTAETGGSGLAAIAPGPRAVLLLPMVAGLDEAHATEALGISPHALEHALSQARTAWPDVEAHAAMRDLLLARIRQPTVADRQAMQALRDEALAEPIARAQKPPPRRRNVVLVAIVLLLALAWLAIAHWLVRPTRFARVIWRCWRGSIPASRRYRLPCPRSRRQQRAAR